MSNDRPLRLRIQDALTECLQTITSENGYSNDVATSVFRGRALFGEGDPLPMLSILEPPIPPEGLQSPANSGDAFGDWDLLIQGFIEDDPENPTDPAHILMAEVKKALVLEKRKRNQILASNSAHALKPNGVSIITSMRIGQGVVRPPEAEISAKAYFWLTVTLTIVEDLDDPFA